jgi:hypothetical protein
MPEVGTFQLGKSEICGAQQGCADECADAKKFNFEPIPDNSPANRKKRPPNPGKIGRPLFCREPFRVDNGSAVSKPESA